MFRVCGKDRGTCPWGELSRCPDVLRPFVGHHVLRPVKNESVMQKVPSLVRRDPQHANEPLRLKVIGQGHRQGHLSSV